MSPQRLLLPMCLLFAGCAHSSAGNFSQAPGFAQWRHKQTSATTLPNTSQRALLERFRPRLYLSRGGQPPIAFYRDYVAHGQLDVAGKQFTRVTAQTLNRYKRAPHAVFTYRPAPPTGLPRVLARLDRGPLPGTHESFIFLTYNLVFRHSGLPENMPWWLNLLSHVAADPADWHQLDIYTALTIALRPGSEEAPARPVAATLQQHNYLRTYLIGTHRGPGQLALPPDGHVAIDIAMRSNELYPHHAGRRVHRAVDFFNPGSARYLITGESAPWLRADDVTDPSREVKYRLAFLPHDDAFYVFQGYLGARRLLPGRDGPPGAGYNTLPLFKPKATQMAVFYWYEGDTAYLRRLNRLYAKGRPSPAALAPFVTAFRAARDAKEPPTYSYTADHARLDALTSLAIKTQGEKLVHGK